jgi:23S rRNA pseudouridine1911/1915/1917 synthase
VSRPPRDAPLDDPDLDDDDDDSVAPAAEAQARADAPAAVPVPAAARLVVDAPSAGVRLDRFLADHVANASRSLLQRHVEQGAVTLNGAAPRRGSATLVDRGDVVDYAPPPPEPTTLEPEAIPIAIVYEDADLVVVNKQAGLVVHPGAGHPRGTLVNALLHHVRDLLPDGSLRPGIVHRLDRDTTGLVVVAKHAEAHRRLVAAFQARTIAKTYRAVVVGVPTPRVGRFDTPFGRHPGDRKKMSSRVKAGKRAITGYRVRAAYAGAGAASVEIALETGRTHQIRVHFADHGHPLVGDRTYGTRRSLAPAEAELRAIVEPFARPALHALRLELDHPMTGRRLRLEAPIPDDLVALEAALEALGAR